MAEQIITLIQLKTATIFLYHYIAYLKRIQHFWDYVTFSVFVT